MLSANDIIRALPQRPDKVHPTAPPGLHKELAWYVTEDDRLCGVLIEDQVDFDFSWVVLAFDRASDQYRAIDVAASLKTAADATAKLREAMLAWYPRAQDDIDDALL